MIDWEKYGFKKQPSWEELPEPKAPKHLFQTDYPEYKRPDLGWLTIWEENEFLTISVNSEYVISEGKIPATNQAVVLLLKAFNCPKLA